MFYKEVGDKKFRYYEKYYDDYEGKWKQVSCTLTSKTRAAQSEARRILEEKIESKLNTVFGVSQDMTVEELISDWLILRKKMLKRNTYLRQMVIVNGFVKVFGHYKIQKVTGQMLQKYFLKEDWSESYRKLVVGIFKIFYSYVCQIGYLKENPIERVVLPKKKVDPLQKQKKMNKFLDQAEMKEYLAYLRSTDEDERFILFCEFLYLTGMRVGEALALQWSNVDIEEKKVTIEHTLVTEKRASSYYLSSPKTFRSIRTIQISNRVIEILNRYSELEQGFDDLIFVYKNKYPIYQNTFNSFLRRTFEGSGIKKVQGFRLTSHVFRHSHISLLVELEVPLKLIMERVGHADEKTTIAIYTHVTKNMNKELLGKLESIDLDTP